MGVVDLLDLLGDRLAVSDLRLADVGLDLELAAHTVDQHLEVQLAHAGDDRLTGLLVGANLEGRILLGQALDRRAELLLVALGLGFDSDRDDRRREVHRLQHDRLGRIAQGVARGGVLEAHDRDDVAGAHRVDLFTLVGVHSVDLADALFAVLGAVGDLSAGVKPARVHAHVGQLAQVRVGHDLECESRKRLVIAGLARDELVFLAGLVALDGFDVQRRGEVGDDGVEHGLNALVLECRAGEYGGELVGEGCATDGRLNLLDREILTIEELHHDGVVSLGEGLEQHLAVLGGLLSKIGRDVLDDVVLALLGLTTPREGLHLHEVDHAEEVTLGADRNLQHERGGAKAGLDHVHAHVEVGAGAVELVDETDAGHVVAVSLPPDCL